MPKLFAVVHAPGSDPELDRTLTPYVGHVCLGRIGQWGAYLISGTGPQLTAIDALAQVFSICAVTEGGAVRWAELDGVIPAATRTKLNNWKTANAPAWPNIPVGATYRTVVDFIAKRMNASFDVATHDVSET
jgi:hypothetical protein